MHEARRLVATVLALLAVSGAAAEAQNGPGSRSVQRVPFGPGERADYIVKLGVLGEVGDGFMEVVGVEDVHGHPTYHLRFDLNGKVLFAKVDDTLESWLDTRELFSRRFRQDQQEVNYKRQRTYEFFPAEGLWKRLGREAEEGELGSPVPLDDVSFIYFVRTLPLEPGKTYTFNRYWKQSGNPVKVHVVRRDTVPGAGGTKLPVLVVRPTIQTSGLFEDGEAELYFTDDYRRILVMMRSKVPVIGSLSLYLKGYEPGRRLAADGR